MAAKLLIVVNSLFNHKNNETFKGVGNREGLQFTPIQSLMGRIHYRVN